MCSGFLVIFPVMLRQPVTGWKHGTVQSLQPPRLGAALTFFLFVLEAVRLKSFRLALRVILRRLMVYLLRKE